MIVKNPTFWNWIFIEHPADLKTYLNDWVDKFSTGDVDRYMQQGYVEPGTVLADFVEDPFLGFQVLKDWIENKENPQQHVKRVLEYITQNGVNIILVLGMPNSGKTTTVFSICEVLHRVYGDKYKICYVSPIRPQGLPEFIRWKSNVWKLRSGEFGIVDEASMKDNARRSSSKKNVDDTSWLNIIRHVGVKIFYITQISAMADFNLTRSANILISKGYGTSAVGMTEIERKHLTENPILNYLKPADNYADQHSHERDWAVITMGGQTYMAYLPPPSFMNDKLSKTYSRLIDNIMTRELSARLNSIDDEHKRDAVEMELVRPIAMAEASRMRDDGEYASTIRDELAARGFVKSIAYWKEFTGESKKKGEDDDFE